MRRRTLTLFRWSAHPLLHDRLFFHMYIKLAQKLLLHYWHFRPGLRPFLGEMSIYILFQEEIAGSVLDSKKHLESTMREKSSTHDLTLNKSLNVLGRPNQTFHNRTLFLSCLQYIFISHTLLCYLVCLFIHTDMAANVNPAHQEYL